MPKRRRNSWGLRSKKLMGEFIYENSDFVCKPKDGGEMAKVFEAECGNPKIQIPRNNKIQKTDPKVQIRAK